MRNNSIGDKLAGVLPLARTAGLVIQELPGETLVYDHEKWPENRGKPLRSKNEREKPMPLGIRIGYED